ncbi:unnamed protein product [Trichogramma brassicae]|uniref:Uncharacterized protein n=1 Tax=Trichogramma brassicae TaxID=86971 RepID=A0A6H5HY32_9HYME|nr:unnamed protein product [Trichogramma brassicae]
MRCFTISSNTSTRSGSVKSEPELRQTRARVRQEEAPTNPKRPQRRKRPNARVNNAVSKRPQTNEQGEPRCFIAKLTATSPGIAPSRESSRIVHRNLPVEILVGRPFTDHETVKYVKEGDTLTFFQVDVPLTAPGLHLRARTDVTMLPNSINFIEIASSDGSCRVPATGNYPVSTRIKEGASIGRREIAELPVLTIVPEKRPIKMEEIVIGEDASPRVAEELLGIINEFRDCVAVDMSEIGCARGVEIEISEKPGATPVYCKPYKASSAEREKMREILAEWRKAGIVRVIRLRHTRVRSC